MSTPTKPWTDHFAPEIGPVRPLQTINYMLDHTLKLKRGPDGTELEPKNCMCSGDGYIHFSVVTTVAEEAAWQALGHDHAIPCSVTVNLFRAAHITKGPLTGIGHVDRIGKKMMWSEGCCMQDGNLIAKVHVVWTIFTKNPDLVPNGKGATK